MNKDITDMAAIAFSTDFYQALGAGRNIADAYKLVIIQMRLQEIEEQEIPILTKKTA